MTKEFVTERLKLIDLYPDKAKSIAKEYGLKENEVELIRKGRISSQPVIDRDARTVINYISTDAIDRDNEVIEHKGVVLDDYMKNPIVPWAHDYHGLPIGKNLWIKSDRKGLVAKTYFLKHDFAEDVFDLYTEDIKGTGPALKAWSVGFVPLKWKDAKPGDKDAPSDERSQTVRRTYKKWLLLEYSAVPVPSNPEALTLMVEKGLIKDGKLKKDIEDFIDDMQQNAAWEEAKKRDETGKAKKFEEDGTPIKEEVEDSCKLVITKPEETDTQIRIPVRDCKVTATITISEKEGITALYCGEVKKIRTYIFSKKEPYSWTMKKALAWVKEHGKKMDDLPEVIPAENIEDIEKWIQWRLDNRTESDEFKLEKKKEEPKEIKMEKWNKIADKNWARFAEVIQPQLIEKIEILSDEIKELRNDNRELISEIRELKKELKEGQVLSAKTRKAIQTALGGMETAMPPLTSLLMENELPKEEQVDLSFIKKEPEKKNELDYDKLTGIVRQKISEEIGKLKPVQIDYRKITQEMMDKARGKV